MTRRIAIPLALLAFVSVTIAEEPKDASAGKKELERIAQFFERKVEDEKGNAVEPPILGRVLSSEVRDRRTSRGVAIDGATVSVYHTLERTPAGLRIKRSMVQDMMHYDLDEHGERKLPGRPMYKIEVAELEFTLVEESDRVHGFYRNISNSKYDPVGWAVHIVDARVTGQTETERGTFTLTENQLGSVGSFAPGGASFPMTWEGTVVLALDEKGKLTSTTTHTDYLVDPATGTKELIKPDPEKNLQNPMIYLSRERP